MVDGDIGEYVALPSEPFPCDIVARYLKELQLVVHKREHETYTGIHRGLLVFVTSTSIAQEELANRGGTVFLRIGTSAGLKGTVKVRDILITTASMKNK